MPDTDRSEKGKLIAPQEIPYAWVRKELTFDGSVGPGSRGKKVKVIQEWLTFHNVNLKIDADYGSATEFAVRQFQQAHNLPSSGVVDADTFAALTRPMLQAMSPISAIPHSYNGLVHEYARQHLEVHPIEIGGQNCGPWVRLYTRGNEGTEWAWCAGFVCFILQQSADTMQIPMPIKHTVSCDSLAADAKSRHLFVSEKDLEKGNPPKSDMNPGSIFLSRRTPTDWVHTGLVTAFRDEIMETIEGNTNDEGSREGYEVCKRIRGYGKKDFVRIS